MHLLLIAALLWAPDPGELLAKVRLRVAENLSRLPNCTCSLTIERASRPKTAKNLAPLDTVRLEVALIGGDELYAWPGTSKFAKRPISELVPGHGMIGTGNFALHLKNIFATKGGADITLAGEAELEGRKALRFDFDVPRGRSQWVIADGRNAVRSPYRGTFWVTPDSLDLMRLEIIADQVPQPVDVRRVHHVADYQRVRIGSTDYLLPRGDELWMNSSQGDSRNRTRYDRCREYSAGSVISFGDAPATVEAPKPVRQVSIPVGIAMELRIDTALGRAAVGDPVTATLTKPLRVKDGDALLPKGTRVAGHVTRLERIRAGDFGRRAPGIDYVVVGVVFETMEAEGLRADFAGTFEDPGAPLGVSGSNEQRAWAGIRDRLPRPRINEGVLLVRSTELRTAGLRMRWRTGASIK